MQVPVFNRARRRLQGHTPQSAEMGSQPICSEVGSLMIHPSKKDWWLVLLTAGVGFALAGATAARIAACGHDHPTSLVLMGATVLYAAVMLGLAYPVTYEIKPPDLVIRSGLQRSQIMLESIEAVQPTRSPSSAPAWSLDRLRIDYRKRGRLACVLISPENKEAFLSELMDRTVGLERREGRLVRV